MASEKFGLKVTQASLNQTALDYPRNMANIYAAIDAAVDAGSDILSLEEMTIDGYEANDDFQRADNIKTYSRLQDIAAYAAARDPNLILSVGHAWRLVRRDVKAVPGEEAERLKNPLYNRLDLPFNVQSMISSGQVLAMTVKMHLFNDERGYEKRYFQEWSMRAANEYGGRYGTINIDLPDGQIIPFGRPILQFQDGVTGRRMNISQIICEEKWVATRFGGAPYSDKDYGRDAVAPSIARYLGSTSGLVAIVPNASPPSPLKMDKHVHLAKLASRYADLVIDTDGVGSSGSTFAQYGHRHMVQKGKLLSAGTRLSFDRVAANTTTARIESAPEGTAAKAHGVFTHDFKNAAAKPKGTISWKTVADWDDPAYEGRDKEEVVRMTALWLFDYMRKSKAQGIMQALSGGADSAFNSVMVSVMVRLAMHELGVDGFCREMAHLKYKDEILAAEKAGGVDAAFDVCMKNMLSTVYMGTNNSSDATRNAARFLMEGGVDADGAVVSGIGGVHRERNVQDLLDFYGTAFAISNTGDLPDDIKGDVVREIAAFLNKKPGSVSADELEAQAAALKAKYPQIESLISAANPAHGLAYENIQARGRQVLVMLMANAEGKMAIANPNLDEARNAYATFGGDLHSGTLNLNAHLPKKYQLEVMQYLHDYGVKGVMAPVRALGQVLKNKPSAELQPKDADGKVTQNDEAALQRTFGQMNRIARYMLHEKINTKDGMRLMNAGEVFMHCRSDDLFKGVSENDLFNMVRLSYARWTVAQHKIHASPIAPTFGSNVDHQTSRRTPNLNGGGLDELASLGVELIRAWAADDGVVLVGDSETALRRAGQDEEFVRIFDSKIWAGKENRTYDLRPLYEAVKAKGWDSVFPPLKVNAPLHIIAQGAGGPA